MGIKNRIWMFRKRRYARPLRVWIAVVILLLGGLAFCALSMEAWAGSMAQNKEGETVSHSLGRVEIDVEYGYGNRVKGGRYIPVYITIANGQDRPAEGVLKIKSMESDGDIYHYDYDVTLKSGEKRKGRYYIPIGTDADRLFVELEDKAGAILAEQQVSLNVSQDVPELFVGILSDNPEDLEYLDGVGIHYSTLRTRSFMLDPKEFPDEAVGLNLLDVIVVNNFKLRELSEQQTSAVMDWVHSGGVLILGTGKRVGDTLGRFAPELLDDSYGSAVMRRLDLGEGFSLDRPEDGMFEIACVDISLHGGNIILSSGGFALLTAASKEQGLIGVAGFDLSDIQRFCQEHPSYVDHFFTSLLGETRINRLANVVYSGNSDQFWSVQSLINTGNVEKLPNLLAYAAVVILYLLIMGPGMYIFLKNRSLQIFYRQGVAVLAVVFAVIIYLMGMFTRFRSTFYTYAAIQDVTADYVTDTTYVNIRNPYNRPYQVELDPSYSVLPITRRSISASVGEAKFTGKESYQIAIERGEERLTIRGQDIPAFSPRYFKLERKQENTDNIGIAGNVDYFEGSISGEVTNHFPFPLENATLMLYGNMVLLGRLEPGQTCRLDGLEILRYPLNHSYAVAEQIIGAEQLQRADISDSAYLLAAERLNMLTFYLDNYLNNYMADARVIAFSTEKEERLFLREEGETYGHTMLTSSIEVHASRDQLLYRSVLMKMPRVISGEYNAESNSMSGMEPLVVEYEMGEELDVESLTFEPVSQVFSGNGRDSYIEAFTGSIYFYNHGSGNYDRIQFDGKKMNVDQLRPYLSPGNTLTVRYVYGGQKSYNAIQLPMPMVAGRER
ncbi:MAG: hypothetical protein HFG53_11295 [Lachnospiraceae bacterium]|jgi:hypothetical protein|nr:hypothetical protein [Lachnospiraceae bacterium]